MFEMLLANCEDKSSFKSSNHYNAMKFNESPVKYKGVKQKVTNDQKEDICHRCGRTGHWVKDCYAKLDVEGNAIASPTKPTPNPIYDSPMKNSNAIDEDSCRRCGRKGHWIKDCFAKIDQNGLSCYILNYVK